MLSSYFFNLILQSFHIPGSPSLIDIPFTEMCCLEKIPMYSESYPTWLT